MIGITVKNKSPESGQSFVTSKRPNYIYDIKLKRTKMYIDGTQIMWIEACYALINKNGNLKLILILIKNIVQK